MRSVLAAAALLVAGTVCDAGPVTGYRVNRNGTTTRYNGWVDRNGGTIWNSRGGYTAYNRTGNTVWYRSSIGQRGYFIIEDETPLHSPSYYRYGAETDAMIDSLSQPRYSSWREQYRRELRGLE